MKRIITFGKEYELQYRLGGAFHSTSDKKFSDGSGPSEITIGPYKSPARIIYAEYLLSKVYGNLLYNYYYDEDDDEYEKGNHFHYRLNGDDYLFYKLYKHSTHFITGKFNKLLCQHNSWRDTFRNWIRRPYEEIDFDDFDSYDGRVYAFITPNRHHKDVLTLEIRASEYSVVGDLCYLASIIGSFDTQKEYEFNENYNYDIGGVIDGFVDTLRFDWIDYSQQEEFKDFVERVYKKYIRENFDRFNLTHTGYNWAKLYLTKKDKQEVKMDLAEILFS